MMVKKVTIHKRVMWHWITFLLLIGNNWCHIRVGLFWFVLIIVWVPLGVSWHPYLGYWTEFLVQESHVSKQIYIATSNYDTSETPLPPGGGYLHYGRPPRARLGGSRLSQGVLGTAFSPCRICIVLFVGYLSVRALTLPKLDVWWHCVRLVWSYT